MDLKINANLVRRWQKELNSATGQTKLLPVNVGHSVSPPDPTAHVEIHISTNVLKIVGAVDSHYVAQLVHTLR